MASLSSSGEVISSPMTEKKLEAQLDSNERIPAHPNYFEQNGLRTYGDDQDHDHEPPLSFSRFMSLLAMAFLWTGSQIPIYLFGAVPPFIYADIGGVDRWTWFVLANLLSLAAICPFVGSLSDLLGRRYVALMGGFFLVLGNVIASTANTMNIFICGMAFSGIGAGINELTALAVTSELAPTRKRGKYVAILIATILPFAPSNLWGQLIAAHAGWRYIGALCGAWAAAGFILTALFYFPPARINSQGLTKKEIISQIDYIGGLLSIVGMILFVAGLTWGGNQYRWHSAHVLAPLLLGIFFIMAFVAWEMWGAKYPMFPRRLWQNPRIMVMTLIITFISGANFFSVILFWPTQSYNVYGHDPIAVGIRGFPLGFGIMVGAFITLWLLSVLRGRNRELLIVASIMMTAGVGSLAVADTDNLNKLYGLLVLAALGIGGIVIPASIMTTIICPDDLIATVSALTLAVRVIGGSVGYSVYYNVFIHKFIPNAVKYVGGVMTIELGVKNPKYIEAAVQLTGASLLDELKSIPAIGNNETARQIVIAAGQAAYAASYRYIYLVSIAFGGVSIIASCFLGNIDQYMDDHVAVVMH